MLRDAQLAHCLMFSDLGTLVPGDQLEIGGDEAHHAARVKRLRPGERVGLIADQGRYAIATLEAIGGSRSKPLLNITLDQVASEPALSPVLDVYAALPKGDRLDRMIDQLVQIGARSFRPLLCDHAQRKPDTYRPDKLQRIAEEAQKQCRRVWGMQIAPPISFQEAIQDRDALIADASGTPWAAITQPQPRTALIVGPEGGWSNTERGQFVETGARVCRFGMLIMRIETAAVVAASVIMNTQTSESE
jgi:16S rRNA (uracil1498-N3)-methyltransferase